MNNGKASCNPYYLIIMRFMLTKIIFFASFANNMQQIYKINAKKHCFTEDLTIIK